MCFCRMPPKRTSKGKEKVGSSLGTVRIREPEGGIKRFLILETTALSSNTISYCAPIPERSVKLDDFPDFEIVTLVQRCGWEKVVE